jgi:predicted dinucleotide-binding enzyme
MSIEREVRLKIGVIGAGSIGSTIARRLSRHGHDVVVANSRGPETVSSAAVSTGARAVTAAKAAKNVDVLIVSVPMNRNKDIAEHVRSAPESATVIDTSNYYPMRDGSVREFEDGVPESVWLSELFGRPVTKAWNAITTQSFDTKSTGPGDPARVGIPVAADRDADRRIAMLWWSRPVSMPSTPAALPNHGASSRVRRFTARIGRSMRCRSGWLPRTNNASRSDAISR